MVGVASNVARGTLPRPHILVQEFLPKDFSTKHTDSLFGKQLERLGKAHVWDVVRLRKAQLCERMARSRRLKCQMDCRVELWHCESVFDEGAEVRIRFERRIGLSGNINLDPNRGRLERCSCHFCHTMSYCTVWCSGYELDTW